VSKRCWPNWQLRSTIDAMAQDSERLEQLARELASLDAADQARVIAEASRQRRTEAGSPRFEVPTLRGGTAWVGGESEREELYGDDGR